MNVVQNLRQDIHKDHCLTLVDYLGLTSLKFHFSLNPPLLQITSFALSLLSLAQSILQLIRARNLLLQSVSKLFVGPASLAV